QEPFPPDPRASRRRRPADLDSQGRPRLGLEGHRPHSRGAGGADRRPASTRGPNPEALSIDKREAPSLGGGGRFVAVPAGTIAPLAGTGRRGERGFGAGRSFDGNRRLAAGGRAPFGGGPPAGGSPLAKRRAPSRRSFQRGSPARTGRHGR